MTKQINYVVKIVKHDIRLKIIEILTRFMYSLKKFHTFLITVPHNAIKQTLCLACTNDQRK